MQKSIQVIAAAALALTVATAVQAQQRQWVKIAATNSGDQVFFDTASQIRVFDAGIKQNTFTTLTLATEGRKSFRQRYQADCFKGTLALRELRWINAQGDVIREVTLDSADQKPIVPAKDTIALDIWRYACAQF